MNNKTEQEKFTPNIGEIREQLKYFDLQKCVDEMIFKEDYNTTKVYRMNYEEMTPERERSAVTVILISFKWNLDQVLAIRIYIKSIYGNDLLIFCLQK